MRRWRAESCARCCRQHRGRRDSVRAAAKLRPAGACRRRCCGVREASPLGRHCERPAARYVSSIRLRLAPPLNRRVPYPLPYVHLARKEAASPAVGTAPWRGLILQVSVSRLFLVCGCLLVALQTTPRSCTSWLAAATAPWLSWMQTTVSPPQGSSPAPMSPSPLQPLTTFASTCGALLGRPLKRLLNQLLDQVVVSASLHRLRAGWTLRCSLVRDDVARA